MQRSAQLGRTLSRRTGLLGLSSKAPLSSVALATTRHHATSPYSSPALCSHVSRLYSTEAAAAAPADTGASASSRQSTEGISKFADLESVGVHQVLIDSIRRGMGYETMSDVQAKTIPIAVTGKDM